MGYIGEGASQAGVAAQPSPMPPSLGTFLAAQESTAAGRHRTYARRRSGTLVLTVSVLPAFLIRQKSEIFDTFPPGEGIRGCSQ